MFLKTNLVYFFLWKKLISFKLLKIFYLKFYISLFSKKSQIFQDFVRKHK